LNQFEKAKKWQRGIMDELVNEFKYEKYFITLDGMPWKDPFTGKLCIADKKEIRNTAAFLIMNGKDPSIQEDRSKCHKCGKRKPFLRNPIVCQNCANELGNELEKKCSHEWGIIKVLGTTHCNGCMKIMGDSK